MAMPCFMKVEAEKQGAIDGSCDIKGHEKAILAYGLDHKIEMPRDPQTGLSSGKRIHGPLSVVKEIDKSSPKLYQALCTGEHLKKVEIKYYRVAKDGKEEHYYTQELHDAIVSSIEPSVPIVFLKENDAYRHMEKVSFTYAKIKWVWTPDGVEAEDSWKGN
jgi:type VI secretion system secreted protein Hcp